jgi:HEAT repeat protein
VGTLLPLSQALNEQVRAVVRVVHTSDADTCVAACRALEALAGTRRRLRQIGAHVAVLRGKDPLPALPPEVPSLSRTLEDKDAQIRLGVLYVLETLEEDAAPALDAVIKVSSDRDTFVRWGAARVLLGLGPAAAVKAVPAAAKLLDDPAPNVRLTAVKILERAGPRSRAAVGKLGEVAEKGDPTTRVAAIGALAAVGEDARPAVPSLIKALGAPEAPVRATAARVLGRIGGGEAGEKALRRALDDPELEVRQAAGDALLGDR